MKVAYRPEFAVLMLFCQLLGLWATFCLAVLCNCNKGKKHQI
jgi:hypothetical protein